MVNRGALNATDIEASQELLSMKLEDCLKQAILEIVESNASFDRNNFSFSFTTTKSGHQVSFSNEAEFYIAQASNTISKNKTPTYKLDQKEHLQLTRQALAEVYVSFLLDGLSAFGIRYLENRIIKERTKNQIHDSTKDALSSFTYHLPAAAVGVEKNSPFKIGPVTIYNRDSWIDAINLPESANHFAGEDNINWRSSLKRSFLPANTEPLTQLTSSLHGAIQHAGSILTITVNGYGKNLSYKLASIVGKSALDCLSLLTDDKHSFTKHTLYSERRPPVMTHTIVETNGYLHLPDSSLSMVVAVRSLDAHELNTEHSTLIEAFTYILNGLSGNYQHRHPELSGRWATALDWYAEACRDSSDAIAITKFGASLDVLSGAVSKASAIIPMVSHLTRIPSDQNIMMKGNALTLAQAITRIYEDGRSEIIHGNQYDRMHSYEELKNLASHFTRITLLCAAIALLKYNGEDTTKAFGSM